MELKALNLSLCRVPAFSIQDELTSIWPSLKAKIKMASPSFYEQIATSEAHQISTLPEKVQFTIWKYFNRAKYRATPFANFASYSLVPLGEECSPITIESEMLCHKFTNWSAKERISSDAKTILLNCTSVYSNTSAYNIDTEIRYLRLSNNTFELATVQTFPELKSIMQYCSTKRSKTQLYEFMKNEHQLSQKTCRNLIIQLLDLQLLHTEQSANITGEDYFKRLKHLPDEHTEAYILAERPLRSGCLRKTKTQEIADALQFLAQQLPQPQNNALQDFKNAFLKKFEHQHVSLAMVMDPELGIGYGNLAQYEQDNELIEQLVTLASNKAISQSIPYTAFHQFLINGLADNQAIALDELESTANMAPTLPNTLSVKCHFYKDEPVIAHAGGCTANALLGRFTLGNNTLEAHGKEIATLEQNANPNVLFFDIAYQAEKHVDNVNRRKSCYGYELPILTWSCQANPLDFNEIMVSIQGDEVILFSKRLGKRLIPRLASAYNYSRSDLSAYRFLCDLQHQSIQSNLTFDFQTYLPGLKHYPRVTYKKVILSPAKWLIPKSIYQEKTKSSVDCHTDITLWLQQKNINALVKTGVSDQTLCFNPNLASDVEALLSFCKQQGDRPIYLSEALIDETSILDERGKKYNAEFIISFGHANSVYNEIQALPTLAITPHKPTPPHYLPASEWLYFEIFIHPSKSDDLLNQEIAQLLRAHKNDITQWFFIRYDEHGKHIRLRLKLKDLTKRLAIIDSLNALLATPIAKGIVSDVQLKTYRRELARYGALRIESVEQFFYLDSKHILSSKNPTYQQALSFMNQMSTICFPLLKDRLCFVKQMADVFSVEFSLDQKGFKKINQAYALIKWDERELPLKQLMNQADLLFVGCTTVEKSKLLADLIHMHINRKFNNHQRLREAICYQFLLKLLQTEWARLAVLAARQASA